MMKTNLILHHINSRGVTLLKVLSHALLLLDTIPLISTSQKNTRCQIRENMELLIISVASLCAENSSWSAVRSLLLQAGLEVTPAYDHKQEHMDNL